MESAFRNFYKKFFTSVIKKYLISILLIISSRSLTAQFGLEKTAEEKQDFERYSNLDLTEAESLLILVGVVLIIFAITISKQHSNLRTGLGCLGFICALPAVFVILALAQNTFGYVITFALVIGAIFYLYAKKN